METWHPAAAGCLFLSGQPLATVHCPANPAPVAFRGARARFAVRPGFAVYSRVFNAFRLARTLMQDKYQPAAVETAAQQHWDSTDAFRVTEDASKPNY